MIKKKLLSNGELLFFLSPHAGGYAEGGGDCGQYGDDHVQDFLISDLFVGVIFSPQSTQSSTEFFLSS